MSVRALQCVDENRIKFFSDSTVSACKDCPQECDTVIYSQSSSNSRYPTLYYLGYLRSRTNIQSKFLPYYTTVSDSQITKSCVLLNVFYDDLATTYTSELPSVTPISLLGSIGNPYFPS